MENADNKQIVIYTDGGCDPNPGAGGWGAILVQGDRAKELSGGALNTTNNRMELTAAVEALKALKLPCSVVLTTDSEYLQRGVTQWLADWKRRGWKRKTGEVRNADLWKELDRLTSLHNIRWRWTRGHAGDPLNERCDELAQQEIQRSKSQR